MFISDAIECTFILRYCRVRNRRISTHKAVCVHAERHIAALNNDNDDTHLTAEGFNETSATVPTKHREQQAYKDLLENNQSRLYQ
ncbi:hypothetical protein WR25_14624 [Diploscapter pachys]|uniref:Uncharacterized protein n=1 Tax=Diploscapter pachys TaxID=2018661 RepID=A0A2A2LF62_9BILA|nr:hypothetical protein WR25_14624 [Diploscapter pachys]